MVRTCAADQPHIVQVKEFPGQQALKIYLPKIFIGAKRVLRFLRGSPKLWTFKVQELSLIWVVALTPQYRPSLILGGAPGCYLARDGAYEGLAHGFRGKRV